MKFEMNDNEVIKGNSDLFQVVKFVVIYLLFVAGFLGISVLGELL